MSRTIGLFWNVRGQLSKEEWPALMDGRNYVPQQSPYIPFLEKIVKIIYREKGGGAKLEVRWWEQARGGTDVASQTSRTRSIKIPLRSIASSNKLFARLLRRLRPATSYYSRWCRQHHNHQRNCRWCFSPPEYRVREHVLSRSPSALAMERSEKV